MKQKEWTPKEIKEALCLNKKVNHTFSGISINSKTLKKRNLFLPFKGKKCDGHQYIREAFNNGASLSLANKSGYKKFNLKKFKKKIILVKNISRSLNKLAEFSRKNFTGKIVGITGSVGKTSVKEALTFILKDKNKVKSSIGNLNNLIGMPLNLSNFRNDIDIGILELGMNKKGEIKKLSQICKPDIGLITKISDAHIGNFNSIKDIALAKSEIFFGMKKNGVAIINNNCPHKDLLKKVAKSRGIRDNILFGSSKECDIRLINYEHKKNNSLKVFLDVLGNKKVFYLNNLGIHWIENSLGLISILLALNKDLDFYLKKFSNISAIQGRGKILNINYKRKKITLIDDAYNSSPESLKKSIIFLNLFGGKRRKICVLGDMFELGKQSKRLHLKVKKILKENNITNVYTIGKEMKKLFNTLPTSLECKHAETLEELYLYLIKNIKSNDVILFKASRAMYLDKIIKKIC